MHSSLSKLSQQPAKALPLTSVPVQHLLRSQKGAEGLWGSPRERVLAKAHGDPLGRLQAGCTAFCRGSQSCHSPRAGKAGSAAAVGNGRAGGAQEPGLLGGLWSRSGPTHRERLRGPRPPGTVTSKEVPNCCLSPGPNRVREETPT